MYRSIHLRLISLGLLLLALVPTAALAQPTGDDENKAYARVPREIVFQNDSQWEDNRWQQTDVGPFLAGTIRTPQGLTLKGMAIRIGDSQQATVCYDTARCRTSGVWTGGFLIFDPRRFGVIRHPEADGESFLSVGRIAGWARNGSFETDTGDQITRLPNDWISYHGFYTHDQRVVVSYSVGETPVLESPWFVEANGHAGFIRTLEIGPSDAPMQAYLADPPTRTTIVDTSGTFDADAAPSIDSSGRVLNVPAHRQTVRIKLMMTRNDTAATALQTLSGNAEDLSSMIQSDRGRFSETLTTTGTTTETGGPYVIDTLTLPFENPWNALLFTAGHDFFSDGTAAICTLHGDVWTVSGIDRELKQLRWRRYATGLSQPLGLKIVDDRVYVINRTQLTRLYDRNGDGEADQYECFNNDNFTTPGSHDYVTCLDTDPDGNFYYIHARTGVMRISPDGKRSETVADGFRNPNGMGVGPDGTITAAPQQGQWTPQSSLIVVREGGYYGYGGPRTSVQRPTGWDLPMCFIPHNMDNSGGGQVWVESEQWGPLAGQMLHLSYGQCRILMALPETSADGDIIQGGVIEFPTVPGDFESGIMRGRFRPQDGQLYVSGLRGWQTRAIRDGCFQRVRYTGGPIHIPVDVKTFKNGIQLTFSQPLDRDEATDPDNFFVTQWNYLWSSEYGSPDFSVERPEEQGRDDVAVVSATLMDDQRTVFLEMPGRVPVNQMLVDYMLASAAGETFRGKYAHTINVGPSESFPDSMIRRREIDPLVPADVAERLEPGLAARLTAASGESDVRILRLAALREQVDQPPSPFLPAGPFEADVSGTIRIPLSGVYEFRLEGNGEAEVLISGQPVLSSADSKDQSAVVRLRKGDNPIEIRYRSPEQGLATWKLWWKGYNFTWEPVPPDALFHDSGRDDVVHAAHRRLGRTLAATNRCTQCHQSPVDSNAMFELTLSAPDLRPTANRLKADWIEQWLVDPASVHSDPSMPAVLPEPARQHAANLAAFLTRDATPPTSTTNSTATNLDGEQLFESLGCIACHHFDRIDSVQSSHGEGPSRLSLHYVDAKFRDGAIVEFLMDPDQHHAASRMPNFALTPEEATALASYLRDQSRGVINPSGIAGDVGRGEAAFAKFGCRQCHALGENLPIQTANRPWNLDWLDQGCLADNESQRRSAPRFNWSDTETSAVRDFVRDDLASLRVSHPVETSLRLVESLRCAACHDRDGVRSERPLIIAEEGSGRLPEVIPSMTWLGEKFYADWNHRLLAGRLSEKPRPWLAARMPAFAAHADALAMGMAIEHTVDPDAKPNHDFDPELAAVGERLTLETGLDCRQCHAIGELQPRGDEKTKIALGINFVTIADRMRYDAYHRFMLDPPRYDINTKMIKLSENGITTKLKNVYDADAKMQFEAVWNYMQSLKD